jgi:hypothetical protein
MQDGVAHARALPLMALFGRKWVKLAMSAH